MRIRVFNRLAAVPTRTLPCPEIVVSKVPDSVTFVAVKAPVLVTLNGALAKAVLPLQILPTLSTLNMVLPVPTDN
jgi:hypothetical protein